MYSNQYILNKISKHFNELKNCENLPELLSKNLKVKNKKYSLLPVTNLQKKIFLQKKIKINNWIKNKKKIAFYLVDNENNIKNIISINVDTKLKIFFNILLGKLNSSEVIESTTSLIKYFNETIYIENYILNKSYSKNIIKKINEYRLFTKKKNILTAGPSVSLLEISNTNKAIRYGWNNNWSYYINKFEKNFAKFIGVKHALSTSSCTGALEISLLALDIGPGDEVIVPDLTWVATASAVLRVGATPVFADVELDSWTIDPNSIKKQITNRTKAIIVVHLYGHPSKMDNILLLSKKYKIKIIEDAAPAIGAKWKNQKCGSFGSFAAFSFQGAKLLVAGEGGMLVTNNTKLYNKAYKIWNQGRNLNKQFWIDGKGVKYKMSNMQAAFGYSQISRVEEHILMKRRIFKWYFDNLKDIDSIKLNKEVHYAKSIYWMTSLFIKDHKKFSVNKLTKTLSKNNIDSRYLFPAISQYPIWGKKYIPQTNALILSKNSINLPSGVTLTKEHIDYICNVINNFFIK